MRRDDVKVEKNTGYIDPVGVDSSIAHVAETRRKAEAEQQIVEKESANTNDGNAEGNLVMDGILEVMGVKTAASLIQVVDERLTDKAQNAPSTGDGIGGLIGAVTKTIDEDVMGAGRKPGSYEGIFERAQIAASSLDLDPKHVNTDIWNGTDTKLSSVAQTRDMSFRKALEHDLLPQIRGVEMQHQAMLGHAQRLAPGLGMNGPSINPQSLLNEAERIAEKEDWVKRTEGGTWA